VGGHHELAAKRSRIYRAEEIEANGFDAAPRQAPTKLQGVNLL